MFKEAKAIIEKASNIYIVGHVNPDGDSIGSCFALYFALNKIGKNATVIMKNYADTFDFLPQIQTCVESVDKDHYDLLIGVDAAKDRLNISDSDYEKAENVIVFDHHRTSTDYGTLNYIDSEKPATSEIVFDFISYMGIKIDQNIATYLYLGIMTDTGSFNYSSTKPSTHIAASKLLETGFDFSYICKMINDTMKEGKLKLIAAAINNMEVFFNGKCRLSYVDYETVKKLGLDDEESEGMTNYLRSVEGTEVAAYIRGKSDGSLKISLRSNGNVDVSKVAFKFEGGGHSRAAGYSAYEPIDVVKNKLLNVVEELI